MLGKALSREQGGKEGVSVGQGVPWAGAALDLFQVLYRLLQLGLTRLLHPAVGEIQGSVVRNEGAVLG